LEENTTEKQNIIHSFIGKKEIRDLYGRENSLGLYDINRLYNIHEFDIFNNLLAKY